MCLLKLEHSYSNSFKSYYLLGFQIGNSRTSRRGGGGGVAVVVDFNNYNSKFAYWEYNFPQALKCD